MYTLKLGTGTAVVLTDRRIIKELLEKKSATSSNRPPNEVGQIIGEGDHLLLMNNTPTWRILRKLIHQDFIESMCNKEHTKIQHAETVQMLHDMLHDPDSWCNHLKRTTNSIVMSIGGDLRITGLSS
jgi:cytochrome P450